MISVKCFSFVHHSNLILGQTKASLLFVDYTFPKIGFDYGSCREPVFVVLSDCMATGSFCALFDQLCAGSSFTRQDAFCSQTVRTAHDCDEIYHRKGEVPLNSDRSIGLSFGRLMWDQWNTNLHQMRRVNRCPIYPANWVLYLMSCSGKNGDNFTSTKCEKVKCNFAASISL